MSIRNALRGGAPIDPFIARHIRETGILPLVNKGLTNREISGLLSLSKLTVECHIKNIYKKRAVGSRMQAVFEARTRGLLS